MIFMRNMRTAVADWMISRYQVIYLQRVNSK